MRSFLTHQTIHNFENCSRALRARKSGLIEAGYREPRKSGLIEAGDGEAARMRCGSAGRSILRRCVPFRFEVIVVTGEQPGVRHPIDALLKKLHRAVTFRNVNAVVVIATQSRRIRRCVDIRL